MVTTPEIWRAANFASDIDPLLGGEPDIIQLATGDIIVGWSSSNQAGAGSPSGLDIIGARYNWAGTRLEADFRMNEVRIADDESDIRLAAVPNGDYLQLYVDRDATSSTLMVERKSQDGTHEASAVVATDAIVNYHGFFDIAVASNTSAMIFYTKNENETGTQDVVYSRSYDPTTGALGTETFVIQNGTFSDDLLALRATALSNGNYALALHADSPGGDDEIWVTLIDSAGALITYDRLPATNGNGVQDSDPTISALGAGGYVVAWMESAAGDTLIRHQRFDSTGALVGASLTINAGANDLNEPVIVSLSDGGYMIIADNDTAGRLEAYHFDSAGTQLGEMRILAQGANITQPTATLLADGRVAVAWNDRSAGAIDMAILDTRDNPQVGTYSGGSIQVGTIRNDTFVAAFSPGGLLVNGFGGNDHITDGGGGSDTLRGGGGNDTIVASSVSATEAFYGDLGFDTLTLEVIADGTVIDLLAGTVTSGAVVQQIGGFERVFGSAADETFNDSGAAHILYAGGGNDLMNGVGGDDRLFGEAGNDTILGGSGTDVLNGSVGHDVLHGQIGDDLIFGGGGDDLLTGALGQDTLRGMAGNDTLNGGDDNDVIVGDAGNDVVFGGVGNDIILGGLDNDILRGDAGADQIMGNEGDDRLFGMSGADTLNGREGHDTISGGTGDDLIHGAEGDDIIAGNGGDDTLAGNAGSDRFIFLDAGGSDVVRDWQNGSDVIDFSGSAQVNNLAQFLGFATQIAAGIRLLLPDGTSILFEDALLTQFDPGDFIF